MGSPGPEHEVELFLRRGAARLAQHPAGGLIVIPAPRSELEAWLDLDPEQPAFFWAPSAGNHWAGLGHARSLTLPPSLPPELLAERAAALLAELQTRCHPLAAPLAPRAFGGLAFSRSPPDSDSWASFGAGRFTLPRWLYRHHAGGASLALVVLPGEGDETLGDEWPRLQRILDALSHPTPPAMHGVTRRQTTWEELPLAEWNAQVEAALEAIREGRLEKVVLARRSRLPLSSPLAASRVMHHLRESSPLGTRFAIRHGRRTFLGATPELLVAREAERVWSEAIAGSSSGDLASEMLSNPKERAEHALTLRDIVSGLRPLCSSLNTASQPDLLRLRHVTHLVTPIRGVLAGNHHVLRILAALHPTPAVGGCPRSDALRWIDAHEEAHRGWYAGPVGWFDARGDGEFRVALRSGLFGDDEALLYAGAGIVEGSVPGEEYHETALKLRAMLLAVEGALET